jgi:hypothetical protein
VRGLRAAAVLALAIGVAQGQQLAELAGKCGVKDELEPQVLLIAEGQTWRKVGVEALKACESCDEVVRGWKAANGNTLVKLERDGAESGDWGQTIAYCYGPKGELKGPIAEFRQASGWKSVGESIAKGRALRMVRQQFYNLDSGAEIARPRSADDWQHHIEDVPAFTKLEQMPWAGFVS